MNDIQWPADDAEYLKMDELEDRRAYRVKCRNLEVGFWDAERQGFLGVREKFGDRYLFMEYHYDTGAPFGTAYPFPYEGMDLVLPDDIPLREHLNLECRECHDEVEQIWVDDPDRYSGKRCTGDRHLNNTKCKLDKTHCGQWAANIEALNLIDPWDQKFNEEKRAAWEALNEKD